MTNGIPPSFCRNSYSAFHFLSGSALLGGSRLIRGQGCATARIIIHARYKKLSFIRTVHAISVCGFDVAPTSTPVLQLTRKQHASTMRAARLCGALIFHSKNIRWFNLRARSLVFAEGDTRVYTFRQLRDGDHPQREFAKTRVSQKKKTHLHPPIVSTDDDHER